MHKIMKKFYALCIKLFAHIDHVFDAKPTLILFLNWPKYPDPFKVKVEYVRLHMYDSGAEIL